MLSRLRNDKKKNRLRSAWIPVLETLEGRKLFSASTIQPLPFLLDFLSDRGELAAKDGQGTGFTRVQQNKLGNEYQPTLIDLDTGAGVLKLTTTGTAAAGSNYNSDNTQVNLLETQFDSTTSGFKITTRLLGPLTIIDAPSEQAGISFGADQDNWVKVVAISQPAGNYIQFADETSGIAHSMTTNLTSIGSFATINTLDLQMVGDAATGKVTAYYAINGGAFTKLNNVFTVPSASFAAFFNSAGRAGIIAAQKNDQAPTTFTFDSFKIEAGVAVAARPSVTRSRLVGRDGLELPAPGATAVPRDAFIAADVKLPTAGAGVDANTLDSTTVKLYRTFDKLAVPGVLNTSGGGDAIVFTPSGLLDPNTQYTFEVTAGLKDTSGAPFQPYTATFTTGNTGGETDPSLAFEKIALPTATGFTYTCVTMGPDGKLYASTDQGLIQRFSINGDGTLGTPQNITSITDREGAPRLITGLAFDPAATSANLILWVSHGESAYLNATDWTGKISKLTGANLQNATTMVVNLPRSIRDHMTNQVVFGPDGKLYFNQGAMTAMGAPDNAWGQRTEHLLSAATLRLDPAKLTTLPLDAKTEDGGTYNPFAANAPLTIYATGVRNAYDLVWTSDGMLFIPTNGSAAGGSTPAGPGVPGLIDVQETQPDFLFKVVQGGYYGHPNPVRNEFVLNGGNPTSGNDFAEVLAYPVGTQPDSNYRGAAYTFGRNYSPNGAIQYHGSAFGGALEGRLLVTEYSGGDDVVILTLAADGTVSKAQSGIAGLTHFVDPLDIAEDNRTGFLYIAEYGGQRLTLVRPIIPGARATPSASALYFNDPANIAGSAKAQKITITNTGTTQLTFNADGFTIIGGNAAQFSITQKPALPTSIDPGASVDVFINYTASAQSIQTASLQIKSNDPNNSGIITIPLRGLGTRGIGGTNEPSLQELMNLYQIPINVGDSNPATTYLEGPVQPNDEIVMPILMKEGNGPVTIEPLASFGVGQSGVPTTRFGWYVPGNPTDQNEMFTITGDTTANSNSQTVRPLINGVTSFDPGADAFGLYAFWPTIKVNNQSTTTYSEDRLNTFDANSQRKIRFYPLKTSDGFVVPNAFIFAFEEFNANYDVQDFVGIIRNVKPAQIGAEVGLQNLDGPPFSDRLVFNRIQQPDNVDPVPDNIVHDLAKLRVRNSGTQTLNISSIVISPQWQIEGTAPTSIAAGGFADLAIRFIANPGGNTPQAFNGTLVINSDDSDEAQKTVQLSGWGQPVNEAFQGRSVEPTLQQLMDVFGYKTRITYPGQNLNQGGRIARVGDEVLSPYWKRADTTLPVNVRQISNFHSQGNPANLMWFAQGSTATNFLFATDGEESQSLFPHTNNPSIGVVGTSYAQSIFTPSASIFGFKVDGESSDPTKNVKPSATDEGHHVRFWVVRDRNGNIVPNTYIMSMDYSGINYDYQDNTYLISNLKPTSGPSTPAGLTATASGGGIQLNWNDNTEANLAGYNVYRATDSAGPFTKINVALLSSSEFNDVNAPLGVHTYYRVTSVDNAGNECAVPATADAIRSNDTTAPAPPTGAMATGSPTGIALDWANNTEGDLAGYNVYRSSSLNGTYTKLNTSLLTNSSYFDSTASVGVTSFYHITAVDTSANESDPASANAVRQSADMTPPAAPTGVGASGASNGITVSWSANTETDIAGYNVYRSDAVDGTFTLVNTTGLVTTLSFLDRNAPAAATSFYRVTAVDTSNNESAYTATSADRPASTYDSIDIGGATPAGSTTIITPGNDFDIAGGGVDIWGTSDQFRFVHQQVTGDFDIKVQVLGLTNTDAWAKAGLMARESLAANSRHVLMSTSATQGYRMVSRGTTGGTSIGSGAATGTYPNVWLRLVRSGNSFTGYRSTDGTNWTSFASVNVSMGSTIYLGMAVLSKNASQLATAQFRNLGTTAPQDLPPAQPTGAGATANASSIVLDWADNTESDLAGYNVYRSSTPGGTFTQLNTGGLLTASTYTDPGVAAGETWYYRITAVDAAAHESSPATASATVPNPSDITPPAAPGTVTPTPSDSGIALDWPNNTESDLAGYNVYRASSPGGIYTKLNTSGLLTFSAFNDTTAPSGATSYYRVTAVDTSNNESAFTEASAARPAATYTSNDIGGATPAGSTTVIADGVAYDVTGGGADIWNTSDQFRYVHQQVTGDFDIKVQIQGLTNTNALAKAGLMVRESLDANSRHVFMSAAATQGFRMSYRGTTGGTSTGVGNAAATYPNVWVRLVRSGSTITGYRSSDGVNWTSFATVNMSFSSTVYLGMVAMSHNTTWATTAQFRNLNFSSGPQQDPPPAQPTGVTATPSPTSIVLDWANNTEPDLAGYNVYRSTTLSGTYTKLNTTGLLTSSAYTDTNVVAGQTYFYQITAVDAAAHESSAATVNATVPTSTDVTPPATPAGLTSAHTSTTIVLDWSPNSEPDLAGYNVYRSTNASSGFVKINTSLVTVSSYTDTTASPGVTSYYRVTAVDTSNNESGFATTNHIRPFSYASADIGGATAGSTSTVTAGSAYNVSGAGDFWGTADKGRFVYRAITGDFDIKVRVASLTNANGNEKAGLMARESTVAGSKNVFAAAWPTAGYRFSARSATNGTTVASGTGATSYPNTWIRLKRVGNVFTAYRSTDGVNWTGYGNATISMNSTIYVGMAVTSFMTSLATAQFRNLSP